MLSRRKIIGREFADDVKSQMADHALVEKYGLSPGELEEVFKTLLDAQTLSASDFEAWTIFCNQTVPLDVRLFRRRMPHTKLDIFEKNRPQNRGIILNASEHGLGIKGIYAKPNTVVTLEIPAGAFPGLGPVVLESRCQWLRRDKEDDDYVGGFYLIAVRQGDWEEFRQIVRP